jgi:hypothetical protein
MLPELLAEKSSKKKWKKSSKVCHKDTIFDSNQPYGSYSSKRIYCGIRRSNHNASRYRLSLEQILESCETGYDLGFRTFVLQSGEDPYFTDCALTLSLGRDKGMMAGANVVMPNLSPKEVREKYLLYDDKICTGDEAAECRYCIERRMNSVGFQIRVHRGDCKTA